MRPGRFFTLFFAFSQPQFEYPPASAAPASRLLGDLCFWSCSTAFAPAVQESRDTSSMMTHHASSDGKAYVFAHRHVAPAPLPRTAPTNPAQTSHHSTARELQHTKSVAGCIVHRIVFPFPLPGPPPSPSPSPSLLLHLVPLPTPAPASTHECICRCIRTSKAETLNFKEGEKAPKISVCRDYISAPDRQSRCAKICRPTLPGRAVGPRAKKAMGTATTLRSAVEHLHLHRPSNSINLYILHPPPSLHSIHGSACEGVAVYMHSTPRI